MDTYLAIVSKRDTRRYTYRPIPDDVVGRILDAGRVTGSASNKQPWRLLIVEDAERRKRLADAVYAPDNVRAAQRSSSRSPANGPSTSGAASRT